MSDPKICAGGGRQTVSKSYKLSCVGVRNCHVQSLNECRVGGGEDICNVTISLQSGRNTPKRNPCRSKKRGFRCFVFVGEDDGRRSIDKKGMVGSQKETLNQSGSKIVN